MTRKTLLMAATVFAVCFMTADSVWACKFLDNLCCRAKRACAPAYPCVTPCDASKVCLPKACEPASKGSTTLGEGTLTIQPPKQTVEKPVEAPKTDIPEPPKEMTPAVPAEPATPTPTPVAEPPAEKPVERDLIPAEPPKAEPPVTEPPKAEPPKAEPPVAEPPKAEPPVAEPPKAEPPVAEPPKPEPPVTEPPVTEPPKAEPPAEEPPKAEPAKPEKGTEPEDNLFDAPPPKNVETSKEPAKEEAKEPVKEEAKEPAKEETKEPVKEPAPPAEEKKDEKKKEKEEDTDLFSKSDAKEYRLWTDASGEFKVKAKFVGIVDGKVRLQKPDGRYVRIEMNLLCSVDQRLVEQIKSLASNW